MNAILKISISFTLFYGYYCFGSEIGENLDKAIKRKYYCGWSGSLFGKPIKILNDEQVVKLKTFRENYKEVESFIDYFQNTINQENGYSENKDELRKIFYELNNKCNPDIFYEGVRFYKNCRNEKSYEEIIKAWNMLNGFFNNKKEGYFNDEESAKNIEARKQKAAKLKQNRKPKDQKKDVQGKKEEILSNAQKVKILMELFHLSNSEAEELLPYYDELRILNDFYLEVLYYYYEENPYYKNFLYNIFFEEPLTYALAKKHLKEYLFERYCRPLIEKKFFDIYLRNFLKKFPKRSLNKVFAIVYGYCKIKDFLKTEK